MTALLDSIHALLPDNSTGAISASDMRDALALVVNSTHHAIVVADNFEIDAASGDHFMIVHNNVVGVNLEDGSKHIISFSLKAGATFDPAAGVFYQTNATEFASIMNTNGVLINKAQMDGMIQHTTFVEVIFHPDLGADAAAPGTKKGQLTILRVVHK